MQSERDVIIVRSAVNTSAEQAPISGVNRFELAAAGCSRVHEQFGCDAAVALGFLEGYAVGPRGVTLPPPPATPTMGRAQWLEDVRRAQAAIAGGRFDKVVLGRAADVHAAPGRRFEPQAVAEALRRQHPDAHLFVIPTGADAAFVGATPELLARLRGRQLTTHALAGPAPVGQGEALLRSPKDLHEHGLVVQALVAGLASLCETLETPRRPRLRAAGSVVHLETPVSGVLRDGVGLLDVAAALHPTPALAGWPAPSSRAWVHERTHHPDALYRGLVGRVAPSGDGELHAAIRMAHVGPHRARLWAGAGIVAASVPETEWDETEWKLGTLRDALAEVRG